MLNKRQYEPWTVEEVEFLVKEYEWKDKKDIEDKLGRNWKAIQAKASNLGLLRGNRLGNIIKIGDYSFNYMINSSGYMLISNPRLKIRSVMAHRYVWELSNKKLIPSDGIIHHKNGNRLDNDPQNLELVTTKDHWVPGAISRIAKQCFTISDEHGFWDRDINGNPTRDIAEALMLIVTELSEAFEGYRNGNIDDKGGLKEELADVLIRLLDLSYGLGLHIENEMIKKMEYNRKRPYKHGKNF